MKYSSWKSLLVTWSCLEIMFGNPQNWGGKMRSQADPTSVKDSQPGSGVCTASMYLCARPYNVWAGCPRGAGADNSISVFIIQEPLTHSNHMRPGTRRDSWLPLARTWRSQTTGDPQSNIFIVSKDCDIISWIHSSTVLACLCLALITLEESIKMHEVTMYTYGENIFSFLCSNIHPHFLISSSVCRQAALQVLCFFCALISERWNSRGSISEMKSAAQQTFCSSGYGTVCNNMNRLWLNVYKWLFILKW